MLTEKPVALFDLDGTLANFPAAMRRELATLAAPGEPEYRDEQDGEPPHITARRRVIKDRPGFWRNLLPYFPGFEILDMCVSLGYGINILTKAPRRTPGAWTEKAQWCEDNLDNIPQYQITMTEDKGNVYGRVLVDDWPKYVEKWLAHRPRGLVIMPAWDYNAHVVHPQVIRYTGINRNEVREALIKQKGVTP